MDITDVAQLATFISNADVTVTESLELAEKCKMLL